MTIEQLANILRNYYNNAPQGYKVASIHAFGMEYANEITQNEYSVARIIQLSGLHNTYITELSKGIKLNNYVLISQNERVQTNREEIYRDNKNTINIDNMPLNQILYGPPGTGKTYNTINHAVAICDNRDVEDVKKDDYEITKKRFDKLKQEHRIEFVTFHQSYSYEEFVEGIKPVLNSDDGLKYIKQDGIFKKICDNANDFEKAYQNLVKILTNKEEVLYSIPNKAKFILKNTQKSDGFEIIPQTEKQTSNYVTKEELKNINTMNGRQGYAKAILQFMQENYPCILIIDEINRGNISKIFGELITLIEPDKRVGEVNELKVRLPYSNEEEPPFGVPKNLFIIGTMNTSDRSIASIDIALRRRFKFVEMMPNIEKIPNETIENINLKTLFNTLNERISYLLDRDHQIGHSYFMNWKKYDIQTLKDVWFDSIMPLLNEYFYGDWEKLQAILGEAKEKNTFIIKFKKPQLAHNQDCSYEDNYFDFAKSENINNEIFISMLKNAKLIKSNNDNEETQEAQETEIFEE